MLTSGLPRRPIPSARLLGVAVLLSLAAAGCAPEPGAGPGSAAPSEETGGATPTAAEVESLAAGPNLLFVTLDTLRADHVGVYGYADVETPNLDRLAAEGVRFEQASTTVPTTLPAHASIFTGQNPMRHGVRNNGTFRLDDNALTLAEILGAEGYATAGFVAAFVLDARFGIAQGFDEYTDFSRQEAEVAVTPFLKIQRRADEVVAEAVAWLGARDGPFFAWVHLYDPHTPYDPPEPFASRYPGRPYDGEIAYVDQAVGTLFDGLEAAGLADDTLIVLTADHGEGLGEHGEEWHTFFVYDTTVKVPLIFWSADGIPAGRVVAGDASVVDLLPTSLALLGVEDPRAAERDGADLRPLMIAPGATGRPGYAESMVPLLNFGWSELRSLRAGGWKYIEAPRPELYDLVDDPAETRNLIAEKADRAAQMRRLLRDMVGTDDPTSLSEMALPVDAETLEGLRSLGYLGGGGTPVDLRGVDPKDKVEVFEAFNDTTEAVTDLILEERWQEAKGELIRLDDVAPNHFFVQYQLGKVSLALGETAEAIDRLEEALRLNPSYSLSYVELAKALEVDGRPESAAALLAEAMRAYPEVFSFPVQLGDLRQRQERFGEALSAYRVARRLFPDNGPLLNRMAALYLRQADPAAAEDVLEALVEVSPEDARAWGNLGMVLGGQGRLEEAEQAFRTALELAPGEAPSHFNLGLVLVRLGRTVEARSAFVRALEIDPGFQPARAELSRIGR